MNRYSAVCKFHLYLSFLFDSIIFSDSQRIAPPTANTTNPINNSIMLSPHFGSSSTHQRGCCGFCAPCACFNLDCERRDHHIPAPLMVVQEMLRVTRPGGVLFVRDLMRPHKQETVNQLALTYVGNESEYSRKLFEDSLHASLSLQEMRDLVAALGFDRESVQPTSDRHWTWAARVT